MFSLFPEIRKFIPKYFIGKNLLKQVAQRATISHLIPMCQGQMLSFQKDQIKNNQEKVETSFSPL